MLNKLTDLALVYKILGYWVLYVLRVISSFALRNRPHLRGHNYTLNKPQCNSQAIDKDFLT